MSNEKVAKPNTVQIASISAVAALLIAGTAGYFVGYYRGQADLKMQIRTAFGGAFGGISSASDNSQPGPLTAPADPVWDVSESVSPVDDSKTVVLSISASKPIYNSYGSSENARLIIRCKEHSTDLFVALDEYLGSDSSSILYRLDGAPSQTDSWSESTDGKAVFAPNAVALSRKLASSKKFFIRISDFRGTNYDTEFKTDGLGKVLPKVASACHWP